MKTTHYTSIPAVALVLLAIGACKSTDHHDRANSTAIPEASQSFGKGVARVAAVNATTVLHHPEEYAGKTVVLDGAPAAVCPKKGCWMLFNDSGRQMRVTFKDYGFFVPLDSAGRRMRMEGVLSVKTVSEADAKHYLEDQGKLDEARRLKGDQKELSFVATGVEIIN